MISCPDIQKDVIRRHYNISTIFYRILWGQHTHHGLWSGNESPKVAAQQLTEQLAREARITEGSEIADIGCGMGGSSIHLAKQLKCKVTGVTISSFQKRWATWAARMAGVAGRAKFLCEDAEKTEFPAALPPGGASSSRGTGYNYFNGTTWAPAPTVRLEPTNRTGFTNIIVTSSGREMAIASSSTAPGMLITSRAQKGIGSWTEDATVLGAAGNDSWSKAISGGANGETGACFMECKH